MVLDERNGEARRYTVEVANLSKKKRFSLILRTDGGELTYSNHVSATFGRLSNKLGQLP